ncbi:MAG: glucokinase [Anaerolineae bacterium]|nr:MAG: glucokinase [Anaerolineae bacterium]
MLLAGDIGGTKTHLALYTAERGPRDPVVDAVFPSRDFPNPESIIQQFLLNRDERVTRVTLGVAGPVRGEDATVTNLPWIIRAGRLRELLQVDQVDLLNDLEAAAYAVPFLLPDETHLLNDARPRPHAPIGVIAPGTGLGQAYLTWNGARYEAHASEGGHTDFGPTNPLEMDLLRYMSRRLDHVSYEWVCSGRGIPNLYAYLKDTGIAAEPPWLAQQLQAASDPTPLIVTAALNHATQPCELALATVQLFVSILGAQAGNLALTLVATGGIYVGAASRRILPFLEDKHFMQSFLNKGRFTRVLIRIPVRVILVRNVGLLGLAHYGLDH